MYFPGSISRSDNQCDGPTKERACYSYDEKSRQFPDNDSEPLYKMKDEFIFFFSFFSPQLTHSEAAHEKRNPRLSLVVTVDL